MKKTFLILAVTLLAGCAQNTVNKNQIPVQEYIEVEAKVRFRQPDGTIGYKDYQPFKTRTVEDLAGYNAPAELSPLSTYGGNMDFKEDATGYFHVKKIGDRWWGIDPMGYRYVNVALNSISMGKSEGMEKALKEKFGTKENWMKETIGLLHKTGFNCAGSWSDYQAIIEANKSLENPMAYTINWNFMSSYGKQRGGTYQQPGHVGYPNNAIFVFDPGFETFCGEHARQLEEFKDDPNLFGYFSDNEMPFKTDAIENYLSLPEGDFGREAAEKWLAEKSITKEQITDEHREAFMAFVGEKYFSIVSKAIKKYDPNHMYIGARFYSNEKHHEKFMRAIGKYVDIVSNNYYGKWTPDSTHMSEWAEWTGKPFIITEYYTKGEDSGMPNQSGAGWIVRTQQDRGLFYQNYNLALLESKNCVGWHYFKYQDNDPEATGVDPSNVDSNKGIVSNRYVSWEPMIEKMRELNLKVYSIIEHMDEKIR